MSAQSGLGGTLDEAAVANMAADIATKNDMLIVSEASKTASTKSEQVALLTTDDTALAKRQVVSTAGNATRDITTYAVQSGDTLSGIASKFNITTSTLKWANNLDDADMVKPGQALTILPVSGLFYTVSAGDTPESLAAKYSANAAQILSFNNAEVKGLTAGMKIIIPDGIKQDAPKPAIASTSQGRVAGASTARPTLTRYPFSGNGYSLGYCTFYVASRRAVPSNWGNANTWYYNAQASGFSVGSVPVPGAIAWTGAGYYGHVGYVEAVSGGMVTISEMNYNGGWNRVTRRTVPAGTFRYIY
jgi:surface antigen